MRRSRTRGRWLLGSTVVAAACTALACSSLLGIDTLTNLPESTDAGDGGDTGSDGGSGCTPDHPPANSGISDDDAGADFTFAMSTFGIGLEKTATTDIYWDLDNVCTCIDPKAIEQCKRPVAADPDTCDLPGGRDATGNRALQLIASAVPKISDQTLAAQIQAGHFGALVSLRGYNGGLNDSRVQVDIVPSYGTVTLQAGKPQVTGDAGLLVNPPVVHDGNDLWSIEPQFGSLDGTLVSSPFADRNAYVRDGLLVAHFTVLFMVAQFDITNSNPIVFRITDVVVAAKLEKDDAGSYHLTGGKMGGRVRAADMLRSFNVWTDPLQSSVGMCDGSPTYGAIQAKLCDKLDVRSPASDDGKGLPCDALSFGIQFASEPAKVYGPWPYPYAKTTCFNGTIDTTPAPSGACP